jgi:acetyl-CoA C-acetyltransferase
MFLDGLEDAYDRGRSMGMFADETADTFQFTRRAQDDFALASLERSLHAINTGSFANEIVTIEDVEQDEQPGRAKPEKIPTLKAAFRPDGTVTAASSASISDGAAALVVTTMSRAEKEGIAAEAVIRAHASHAQAPHLFTTAPIFAIRKVLEKAGWSSSDVDLYEINEAFAVVPMAAMHELGLPHEKVNVNGGACALGHPLGCSGTRIIVTLLSALASRGLKRGVASLCIGGGEATAIAIELI